MYIYSFNKYFLSGSELSIMVMTMKPIDTALTLHEV